MIAKYEKQTTNISIRMDKKLKEEAENLYRDLGMNLTTAFNIFVKQSVREQRIPFEISFISNEDRQEQAYQNFIFQDLQKAKTESLNPNTKWLSHDEFWAEVEKD